LLVVTDSLRGGLGAAVKEHVEWFQAGGWTVRVAAGLDPGDVSLPVEVDRISLPDTVRRGRAMVAASRELRHLLREARPSVVHCHGMRSFLAAAVAGCRPVVHLHGSGRITDDPLAVSVLRQLFLRALPRLAAAAFSTSPELDGRWDFAPIASPRLPSLEPLPFPPHDSTPTFLWLGRLADQKRADLFVEAIAAASLRTPVRGVVAGSGPQLEDLRVLAASLRAPVEFLGHRRDIVPLLREAWAVVLLTRFEGMPLAIEEAMWSARTIVASDIAPLAWLVNGAGLLVRSVEEAANAIVALTDPELSERLGREAAARVRSLLSPGTPWTLVERRYEALLGAAADGPAPD
jgi:glycosyltransferase involved in cell wall biosynthesis